jgi:hypothetical protein
VQGLFTGVKTAWPAVDHQSSSSADVKGRVDLCLYSPSGPSWPVLGLTLPCHKQQDKKNGLHNIVLETSQGVFRSAFTLLVVVLTCTVVVLTCIVGVLTCTVVVLTCIVVVLTCTVVVLNCILGVLTCTVF